MKGPLKYLCSIELQISLPFSLLHLAKSLPLYTPEALKRYTFQVEPPCIGLNLEYMPTPLPCSLGSLSTALLLHVCQTWRL